MLWEVFDLCWYDDYDYDDFDYDDYHDDITMGGFAPLIGPLTGWWHQLDVGKNDDHYGDNDDDDPLGKAFWGNIWKHTVEKR